MDLLWAEACRVGDLDKTIQVQVATHKANSGSGQENRKRARLLAARLGHPFVGLRLTMHLRWAEERRFPLRRGVAER